MSKSKRGNQRFKEQIGMSTGKASARLKKSIMFALVRQTNKDSCSHCGELIENIDELSVEHVTPWSGSDDPIGLFFDLSNIAFSHISCNISAARKPNQKYFTKEERKKANAEWMAKDRAENGDKINERRREWRDKNKDSVNAGRREYDRKKKQVKS